MFIPSIAHPLPPLSYLASTLNPLNWSLYEDEPSNRNFRSILTLIDYMIRIWATSCALGSAAGSSMYRRKAPMAFCTQDKGFFIVLWGMGLEKEVLYEVTSSNLAGDWKL